MVQSMATERALPRRAGPELAVELRQLGFTDYEARAYLALLRIEPATAYEVAKLAGLPRANVYGALRALEDRGAIQPVTESPVRYSAQDPAVFFAALAERTSGLCSDVARRVKRREPGRDEIYTWVAHGEEAVQARLASLIDGARERIMIKGPAALIEPGLPRLHAAAARGVQVRMVVFGDAQALARLRGQRRITVLAHEGDGLSHGPASDALLTLAADLDGVMVVTRGAEVTGSHTRNRSLVYVIQTLLLHELYLAEIFAAFGPSLDARFGPQLRRLRVKYRPPRRERMVVDAPRAGVAGGLRNTT
jgi:sugar-specific transcriptional regulator TrmB